MCFQANSIVHLIEGPSSAVLRILDQLASHEHFCVEPFLQTGSIVYNVEDRPKRYCAEWYSSIVPETKQQVEEITEDNCKDIVSDFATRLLNLGGALKTEGFNESRYVDAHLLMPRVQFYDNVLFSGLLIRFPAKT